MYILGIETSCDETAAAIVKDGVEIISQSLASSASFHEKTGGVVPEVAARKQVEFINLVIDDCIKKSHLDFSEIDAVAVTVGPGLIGSLVVGVEAAKALALALGKPIVPVNHLVGHIYGNFIVIPHLMRDPGWIPAFAGMTTTYPSFPAVVLIVSGGHTDLVLMKNHGEFEYLGGTLDDAAGEAFDKVARLLGLSKYLGGVEVSKAAKLWDGTKSSFKFKRPMIDSKDLNFSFSGIKTAVFSKVKDFGEVLTVDFVNEVSYEFQEAVTDVLVFKTMEAVKKFGVKTVMLAGGVSANEVLRKKMVGAFAPPLNLCGDNAVYIASCAFFNFKPASFEKVLANPSLSMRSEL